MENKINPLEQLSWELQCIEGAVEYEIAVRSLTRLPYAFWIRPASSTGKYHPKTSLGLGGLLRHTKSVFKVSEELLGHPMVDQLFDSTTKDQIRVAILLHDGLKNGVSGEGEHTVHNHPLLIRNHACPWNDITKASDGIKNSWDAICTLIETHMGPWTKDRQGNEILKPPTTHPQIFVHLCDYIASRKAITVDIYDRGEGKKIDPPWRSEPATSYISNGVEKGQIPFIKKLYADCLSKGITVEPVKKSLTKGEASDLIQKLQNLLEGGV